MASHNAIYDFMAERFRALGKAEVPVERIIKEAAEEGFTELWEMPRNGIVNGMKVRGIAIKAGMMLLPAEQGENFEPVTTDFNEFTAAARRIVDEADYPIDPPDLLSMIAMPSIAIPLSSMGHYLKAVGIHYIPGVGYWRAPQFTGPDGRIVSKHCRSERVQAISDCFEALGWPIVGPETERHTGGLVTSRFLTRYAATDGRDIIAGIGSGLFVPRDQVKTSPIPMSRGVATGVLALDPTTMLDDHEHLRLFRIAIQMERKGFAKLRLSRTTRDRIRRQTVRITLNDKGRAMLEKNAKRGRDEF